MATKTADKFKCPKCGSGRTKPVSVAIATGTRRRNTVGVSSRRSVWGSSSTYQSDLVAALPQRPSNAGAYIAIFLGVVGLLFALMVGSDKNGTGFAAVIGIVSALFLWGGISAKKKPEELTVAQASWDKSWMCARCGNQWKEG